MGKVTSFSFSFREVVICFRELFTSSFGELLTSSFRELLTSSQPL